jgi:uncharacterized membrane protein YeaQ/YmgE (transglycosylase-associated protein family)
VEVGKVFAIPALIMSYLVAWVCIGLAAALGAWIWPFRRGVLGVAVNAGAAIIGAVGAPLLGIATGLSSSPGDPRGLLLAVLGALALLAIVHLAWHRAKPAPHPAHR